MEKDKEFIDKVHINIHSVRLISGYKPTEFEKRISALVIERFKDSCDECKQIGLNITNRPQQKSFLKKLGEAMNK